MAEISTHIDWKKRHAKYRFKAIIRQVMVNYEWLGDVEDQELGDDVRKNIYLLTMKKRKGKDKKLLSLYEKVILWKSIQMRTDEEQMHLACILSDLKCFRKYHPGVRDQLAASLYYVYYRPGRVIVKQFQEAHALYFLISGTVNVKQFIKDPILGTVEDKVIGSMEAGDMFGEVSLLHDIRRTATIETATACDLLMLKRKDFDRVLKNTVKAEWDQILSALKRFTYFENFTEIEKRECCILSKIKVFPKDSIIVGDSLNINHVHFILKGRASILVQLLTDSSDRMLKEKLENMQKNKSTSNERFNWHKKMVKNDSKCLTQFAEKSSYVANKDAEHDNTSALGVPFTNAIALEKTKQELLKVTSRTSSKKSRQSRSSNVPKISFHFKPKRIPDESVVKLNAEATVGSLPKTRTHMMHIGTLKELGCFGVGEDLKTKIIIADTDVTCLQIPYFWLMQRYKMTWLQVKNFWDRAMPNNTSLFKEFENNRKWEEYKKKLCRIGVPVNCTLNVPYSIRIHNVEACSLL